MEEPKDEDIGAHQLIAQKVIPDPEFPHLPRIVLAQPRASAGKIEQPLWCLFKFLLDLAGKISIVLGDEIDKAIDVVACLGRPSYRHAARAARDRALRLAAKCFSTSSWV